MTYLYYTFYKFILITPSKDELPEHIANIILALVLWLNLFIIVNILQSYNLQFVKDFYHNKNLLIGLYLFFWVMGYLCFIKNKKYLFLKEKYDKEKKSKRAMKMTLVFLYVLATFIFAFVSG